MRRNANLLGDDADCANTAWGAWCVSGDDADCADAAWRARSVARDGANCADTAWWAWSVARDGADCANTAWWARSVARVDSTSSSGRHVWIVLLLFVKSVKGRRLALMEERRERRESARNGPLYSKRHKDRFADNKIATAQTQKG